MANGFLVPGPQLISVSNDRQSAIAIGSEALLDRFVGNLEQVLPDWNVQLFRDGDKPVGMLMTKGQEIHVAIGNNHRRRWLSRRLIREVLGGIISEHGHATTKVMRDNAKGIDFVERLGFKKERQDDLMIYYRITNESANILHDR